MSEIVVLGVFWAPLWGHNSVNFLPILKIQTVLERGHCYLQFDIKIFSFWWNYKFGGFWHNWKELFKTFKLVFVWTPYLYFSLRYATPKLIAKGPKRPPKPRFHSLWGFFSPVTWSYFKYIWTHSCHCFIVNIRKINWIYRKIHDMISYPIYNN